MARQVGLFLPTPARLQYTMRPPVLGFNCLGPAAGMHKK